jgi:hypothetical protein
MDQPSFLSGVGIASAGSIFVDRAEVPPLCPKSFGAHPRALIHYIVDYKREWWTHKGSNLGPLPCEGNALPLSYASGNGENYGRQSPRFTKCGPLVSSDSRAAPIAFSSEVGTGSRQQNALE